MSTNGASQPEVLARIDGRALILTLNRQKALNALNLSMVRTLRQAIAFAAGKPQIELIVLEAAEGRAFSAGGDIVTLCGWGRDAPELWETFFREEYSLDLETHRSPKPVVALWDGIVMGGGAGISMHTARRVASQNMRFAMPEVGIGFYPDVGGTHLLPRLKGRIGRFLALTGERIGWQDARACGLATDCVAAKDFPALKEELCKRGITALDRALLHFAAPQEEGPLAALRAEIDTAFAGHDLLNTLASIAAMDETSEAAKSWLSILKSRSPTSLLIANRQMLEGATRDLERSLALEYRISERIRTGHDFYEGVRAAVIDKDQAPQWQPARLEDVTAEEIDAYFAPVAREWSIEPRVDVPFEADHASA